MTRFVRFVTIERSQLYDRLMLSWSFGFLCGMAVLMLFGGSR